MKLEFGIRMWAGTGTLLRLSLSEDGQPKLECWLSDRKIWKPCGLFDKYGEAKPATAAELYAAGLSADGTVRPDLVSRSRRAKRRS